MPTPDDLYSFIPASGSKQPILISIPHAGTILPFNINSRLHEEFQDNPEDTDWFVDLLYDWAPQAGIAVLKAEYSRYVVDLNRARDATKLYRDDRLETGLVPTQAFSGKPLYQQADQPSPQDMDERIAHYYDPYHRKIKELLAEMRQDFSDVLLWEAHSIKGFVPQIHPEPFPDLILGSGDETTAAKRLIEAARSTLSSEPHYTLSHNAPFKGGYITRNYALPSEGIHALQLEMSQRIYMDESTTSLNPDLVKPLKALLQKTLLTLAAALKGQQ